MATSTRRPTVTDSDQSEPQNFAHVWGIKSCTVWDAEKQTVIGTSQPSDMKRLLRWYYIKRMRFISCSDLSSPTASHPTWVKHNGLPIRLLATRSRLTIKFDKKLSVLVRKQLIIKHQALSLQTEGKREQGHQNSVYY